MKTARSVKIVKEKQRLTDLDRITGAPLLVAYIDQALYGEAKREKRLRS